MPGSVSGSDHVQFWRHLAEYFPAKLIKTGELDPQRNYIFCAHPHGAYEPLRGLSSRISLLSP
eukprot:482898-Pelagomonas_calceolata.AAC.2